MFRDIVSFYGEELLAPCPTPKLEDHSLSAVVECLFRISQLPSIPRGRIRSLMTRHAVVTDPLMMQVKCHIYFGIRADYLNIRAASYPASLVSCN
jgi:hypothetical protein